MSPSPSLSTTMASPTSRANSPAHTQHPPHPPQPHHHHHHHEQPTTIVIDSGGGPATTTTTTTAAAAATNSHHHHRPQPQPPGQLQQMVKSLQVALQKKSEECVFWRDLYTNVVSQNSTSNSKGGTTAGTNGHHQPSQTSGNGQSNSGQSQQQQQRLLGGGDKDPKRALEEATGYFAMEMANKKLKTEQHSTVMKEKLGKVLEQLSRQQQLCKEKEQQMVLREKQYEMDLARRDHELQMCKLEKDHAVELARLQVKLRYLEEQKQREMSSTIGEGSASLSLTPTGGASTRRSESMEIQESKLAQLQSGLHKEILSVREDLEGKVSRLSDLQDSKFASLKDDHEEKITRLRLDLETRLLTNALSVQQNANTATTTIAAGDHSSLRGRTSSVTPDNNSNVNNNNNNNSILNNKQAAPLLRQLFDCQGDCDNSKLFTANCPIMTSGNIYKWTMRIKRRNGSPRMGVVSTVCSQLDSGKWLGESGIGWGYSDWGQTWYEGRHIKTDLPRFDEGDKVTFTLDLTTGSSGTLSASVNDDTAHLLFFDMLLKVVSKGNSTNNNNGTNGGGGNNNNTSNGIVGFLPAATLLNSRVEFSDFESY